MPLRLIIFASIFLLVMAAANFYIYRRFFKKLSPHFSQYAAIIPITLMAGEIFFMLDRVLDLLAQSPLLYMINSAFIGITFMLFVIATIYDLTITTSRRVPFDQGRRRTIKILFDITMLIAATAYLLRGFSQGIKAPGINSVEVKIKDFPIDNYSIVQLSDVHVGRTIKRGFIEETVARTNALHPDMVVITGDLIDLPLEDIRQDLEPLQRLQCPCYFILGNHEYFHGAEPVIEYLRTLGIRPLLNESEVIEKSGQQFNLVGVNDVIGERIGSLPLDFDRAFDGVDTNIPTILLCHQPKGINLIKEHQFDLMLSGHTHGGQIFPFGFLVMIDQPYLAGLHRHDARRQIFVSRGTGYWGPPLRVLAPSEISHIIISAG
ncbi:hypothetical protein BOW53_14285 [Solemya pervernicosa gill symbiont]|uniref:Calcineurin-like phosphoesterase domain-containing protein n=2 Tax=Gammaproteobacteria incertae sedis TaxID=118884 RepID=A0A1T2L109_9GAMM|nr:metallophosphoesterase [Candidatus Reidiella endopervernicosa]OOZ38761.1 hypothetical protein BOW53_14285 [Solemya pervernicosa gill symbiont]QKQ26366.1 metallophosphoesterase [Candidatus Reidiella endopervernicosa]